MENLLPPIPAKRYFTIGEVSDLCGVKPYVLRYWEQEFTQLKPMKRRGNRRYYQHHEVLLIRRIRELLYDQGFTISGARNRLQEMGHFGRSDDADEPPHDDATSESSPHEPASAGLFGPGNEEPVHARSAAPPAATSTTAAAARPPAPLHVPAPAPAALLSNLPPIAALREELLAIRQLLLD
jgi:DNA-binding transcriptional MerR regulator